MKISTKILTSINGVGLYKRNDYFKWEDKKLENLKYAYKMLPSNHILRAIVFTNSCLWDCENISELSHDVHDTIMELNPDFEKLVDACADYMPAIFASFAAYADVEDHLDLTRHHWNVSERNFPDMIWDCSTCFDLEDFSTHTMYQNDELDFYDVVRYLVNTVPYVDLNEYDILASVMVHLTDPATADKEYSGIGFQGLEDQMILLSDPEFDYSIIALQYEHFKASLGTSNSSHYSDYFLGEGKQLQGVVETLTALTSITSLRYTSDFQRLLGVLPHGIPYHLVEDYLDIRRGIWLAFTLLHVSMGFGIDGFAMLGAMATTLNYKTLELMNHLEDLAEEEE